MEGQQQISGEPPRKVKSRKSRARNPTVDPDQGTQALQPQQPPIRKSNRTVPPPPPQSEEGNWDSNHGYDYGNTDHGQDYPEHYGYGDEHVDAYGYGYDYGGAEADGSQGYGYGGAHADANLGYVGYDYGGAEADGSQGYGHGGAHADANQGYVGYDYGYDYGYGQEHGDGQEHGYGGVEAQDYGYGGVTQGEYQLSGYVAPAPQVKGRVKKQKKPKAPPPVADGGYHGGYEHQGDGQQVQAYADGYVYPEDQQVQAYADGSAYPEAYNAVPEQQPKRKPKHRKPKTNPGENGSGHVDGEPADGTGSARSRSSQDGCGSARSQPDAPSISHHGSSRLGPEATPSGTPRVHAIVSEQREGGSGGSNPERRTRSKEKLSENEGSNSGSPRFVAPVQSNPLNDHVRKHGSAKPKPAMQEMSMVVVDPLDRTLVADVPIVEHESKKPARNSVPKASPPPPPAARSSLDEFMKQQAERHGQEFHQDMSLIVYDDHEKDQLETTFFGAPLAKKQSNKLPPVVENPASSSQDGPQYQLRGKPFQPQRNPGREKLMDQSVQRRSHSNSPLPLAYHQQDDPAAAANNDQQIAKQQPQPSAKCMACVHGIGVPIAKLATRTACHQGRLFCQNSCTIL